MKETHPCNGEVVREDDDPDGDDTVNAEAEADATVTHPANTSTEHAGILLRYAASPYAGLSRFPMCLIIGRQIRIPEISPPTVPFRVRTAIFPLLLFRKLSPRSYRVRRMGHGCDIGKAQLVAGESWYQIWQNYIAATAYMEFMT